MDNANISPELLQGLQNLPDKDKLELSQFVAAETQKAQIQSSELSPDDTEIGYYPRISRIA
jgi:hypothetical protein